MELVTQPRLRAIIEQITSSIVIERPDDRHGPTEPVERESWFADVAQLRAKQHAQLLEMIGPAVVNDDDVDISEVRIPITGSCGWSGCAECTTDSINAIVYRPIGATNVPAYLNFHGGGWWVNGGVDVLRATGGVHAVRARELGIVVVDVDYRMSPDHKFPIPVEDCYAALLWFANNGDGYGVDPTRMAVGGGSAGGNLAAAVALISRDRGGPILHGQVLNIPVTDSSCNSHSMHRFANGYVMTRQMALDMWDMYLASPVDAYNPYASPLHAAELGGLPPALVVLGDYDILRDEGMAYASRLIEDGVTVTARRLPQCHGAALPENGPETERLTDEFLRANLLRE